MFSHILNWVAVLVGKYDLGLIGTLQGTDFPALYVASANAATSGCSSAKQNERNSCKAAKAASLEILFQH